eukprot:gene9311-9392_t
MIHYTLQCGEAHEFDGWFASSAAFDSQVARSLVECPICGSTEVVRGLMAPAVPKKANAARPTPAQEISVVPERMPAHVRSALQRLRAEVERHADYVGDQFADTARQMHEGEVPARPIYGETTAEQAEALAEDGIEIARIPWIPRADG